MSSYFWRLDLARVFLLGIAECGDLGMAEEGVVVEVDLGVEAEKPAVLRLDQRVDLAEAHVLGERRGIELADEIDAGLDLRTGKAEAEGDGAADEGRVARGRVDMDGEDFFRRRRRHFLDIHAALGRGDEGDTASAAVDQAGQIELAGDIRAFLDIEAVDPAAVGAGLVGDERAAEHRLGVGDRLLA